MLFPEIVNIELINSCNLLCRFCDYKILRHKMMTRNMPENILTKILVELRSKKIYELGLVGLGEPLLNRNFEYNLKIINDYKDSFERISLNSNAVALSNEKIEIIYNSPINFITFSLNAGTQESYIKMMGKDYFDIVISNIINFIVYGKKLEHKPKIRIQLMQQASHELDNALKLFENVLDDNVKIFVRKEYNKPVYHAVKQNDYERRYPCWSIYSRVYLDVLGNIYPCTIGNDSYRETSSLCIGNITDNSLLDVFNNNKIKHARLKAEQGACPFIECGECNIWEMLPNNFKWRNDKWHLADSALRLNELQD